MHNYLKSLARKKTLESDDDEKPKLKRVLSLVDLIGLGVGSTLGVGVYVLAGSVAKNLAGPAVVISFVVAAIASAFAGVCYAEFAARVPKAGSAYVYSYVSVGELVAFIIGWNLILEYVIGTASVAKALSVYIDALTNGTMKNTLGEVLPIRAQFLASYPDFLAFGFVIVVAGLLAFGVKESTTLNNVFTSLNLCIIFFVIVAGSMKADPNNWFIPKDKIEGEGGEGGFMPYGVKGIMAGASKCFFAWFSQTVLSRAFHPASLNSSICIRLYAVLIPTIGGEVIKGGGLKTVRFVGFDCIATTGEEAKNPRKNIPLAILSSLIIIFLSYFGISVVLTMMYPYYLQDAEAPFPHVFEKTGRITVKWVVTIGAVIALCTSLLGAMFPLPRVLYAMGTDGILFKSLARINVKTQTPLLSTVLSGLLAGVMAMMLDLQQLIDMMSIGTLLAYTIVAVCVLVLRFEPNDDLKICPAKNEVSSSEGILQVLKKILRKAFNLNMLKHPTKETSRVTKWGVVALSVSCSAFSAVLIYAGKPLQESAPWAITLLSFFALLLVLILVIIGRQPLSPVGLSFKVPFVPFIPALSLFINVYLMLELDYETWVRFAVWMTIGFLIYFFYGHKNSQEGLQDIGSAVRKESHGGKSESRATARNEV